MKNEDYNRLKSLCEENGFELLTESPESNDKYFVVKKAKDIWEGVEFVVRVNTTIPIYRVKSIGHNVVYCYDQNGEDCDWGKTRLIPSTEQAYIDQLKKECFERKIPSIKIKEIDISMMSGGSIVSHEKWIYRKDFDTLYFFGVPVYQQGKWAKRVPERVKVKISSVNSFEYMKRFEFTLTENKYVDFKTANFLASQLEAYLNGEIK